MAYYCDRRQTPAPNKSLYRDTDTKPEGKDKPSDGTIREEVEEEIGSSRRRRRKKRRRRR
jgi:hypothetical protein